MNVFGYAAQSAKEVLVPYRFERREPRPDDVVIQILYCGVCHSDLHHVRNDWGRGIYPMVPGHEIIGRIIKVGGNVTRFKPDDHVGVGCMVDSCRHCTACEQGLEQYCQEVPTYTFNSIVLKVPDGMDLKGAAPLLCAGITTWSPLRHWKVEKGSKVAVVGLGGLGHMALKLSKALGADATLITRSPGKEQDARRLGAGKVVLSTDEGQMAAVKGQFELIIDTVPYVHDLTPIYRCCH